MCRFQDWLFKCTLKLGKRFMTHLRILIVLQYTDSLSHFRCLNHTRSPLSHKNFEQILLKPGTITLAVACSGFAFT